MPLSCRLGDHYPCQEDLGGKVEGQREGSEGEGSEGKCMGGGKGREVGGGGGGGG